MFKRSSTNADITKHDCARRDRAALLRSQRATPAPHAATATRGWGTDVASGLAVALRGPACHLRPAARQHTGVFVSGADDIGTDVPDGRASATRPVARR